MTTLTISEFCRVYRISPRTVWNWVRKGRLRALHDSHGRILRLIDPNWPVFDECREEEELVDRYAILKTGEVALLVGLHSATVRRLVSQGRLGSVWIGRQRRFSLGQVRRLLAERALGRPPKDRNEINRVVLRWAAWRLGLSRGDPTT
jgi:excisionase family DNA binding protein